MSGTLLLTCFVVVLYSLVLWISSLAPLESSSAYSLFVYGYFVSFVVGLFVGFFDGYFVGFFVRPQIIRRFIRRLFHWLLRLFCCRLTRLFIPVVTVSTILLRALAGLV